jgi:serine/threonine protein kinase
MAKSGPKEFQAFLTKHRESDEVTGEEILAAVPGWGRSSLDTYRKKHKLDRFLSYLGHDRYRVVRDGVLVTEADINAALTQVNPPTVLTLTRGEMLTGNKEKYELYQQVGRGAVGTVWKGRAVGTGAAVAVKICNPRPDLVEPSVLQNVQDRFRRESRLGQRVQHDAIVKYLDTGEHLKAPFLVMELAVESVRDRLDRVGRLQLAEVALIGESVVAAIIHLAANSCVHRDVKPPNILIADRGYVLSDLGILRWGDLNRDFTGAGTITKATVQLGSWNYMSPEQVANPHAVTSATDVYALGVTFIELLTGKIPPAQMVAAGKVPPPSESPEMNSLIAEMTKYEAAERPSLEDVAKRLALVSFQQSNVSAKP